MNIHTATDEMLRFTQKDCVEAIAAHPCNPKAYEYLEMAKACGRELERREFAEIDRLAREQMQRETDRMKRECMDRWNARFAEFASAIQ